MAKKKRRTRSSEVRMAWKRMKLPYGLLLYSEAASG
jgi:hypothetical protein